MACGGAGDVGFGGHRDLEEEPWTRPTGGPSLPPTPGGEADLASTTEFRAFLAGDPVPTGADAGGRARPGPDGWLARLRALFQSRSSR